MPTNLGRIKSGLMGRLKGGLMGRLTSGLIFEIEEFK